MNGFEKKKIYAILWVDDWSSFPLSKKDIQWFHKNAGPISLCLEMDDRLPRPFREQLRALSRGSNGHSIDYMAHHYHSVRWAGSGIAKKIHDAMRLRKYAYFLSRLLRIERLAQKVRMVVTYNLGPKTIRLLFTTGILAFVAAGVLLYNWHWAALVVFLGLGATVSLPIGLFLYVQLEKNWKYTFSDWEQNRSFFEELKQRLQEYDAEYPQVLRHGWDLPPASSMAYYLTEMNVLADASASPTPEDAAAGKGARRLLWKYTQPYYASLSKDYDVVWSEHDEEDRGILEMPISLGNIAEHGFGEFAKERIKQTPDEGLVSTYMHGWDDFSPIKEWVAFLKQNYDVTFVGAGDFAKIYMKRYPRPVLIDKDLKAGWALRMNGRLHRITDVDRDTVSVEMIRESDGITELLLCVNTEEPVPEIGIDSRAVTESEHESLIEESSGMTVMKKVRQGTYHLKLRDLAG